MMKTEIVISQERKSYDTLARTLLDEIRAFFADPENEAEFQRWKEERRRGGEEA